MLGFVLLWIAIKFPVFSRKAWGLLMILACLVNSYVTMTDPTSYIEFGVLAIPPMQHFIYSKYFANPVLFLFPIAVFQFVVGIILLLSKTPSVLKLGLAGAIFWFVGIASLGLASAFPSSLIFASTMMLCWPTSTDTPHKQKVS